MLALTQEMIVEPPAVTPAVAMILAVALSIQAGKKALAAPVITAMTLILPAI